MFERDKKTEFPDQPTTKFKPPIVVLDVDETLILGKDLNGFPIDRFNDRLINELLKACITEVYLLTSFKLNILKTKEKREESRQLLRLELIKHLEDKGITVKALVSNYDIICSASQKVSDIKENNWISKSLPGHYYNTVIKPYEKNVKENPDINLNENKEYLEVIKQQQKDENFIDIITALYQTQNVKAPLADLLFTFLKKENIISENASNPQTVLFFDDRMICIHSLISVAKKHKLSIDCLQITAADEQNYFDFLSNHYPILEYQHMVPELESKLVAQKTKTTQELPKPFLFSAKYTKPILTPIQIALDVFDKVKKDMKNINKHDCIGACNAMTRELLKRKNELNDKRAQFPKNVQDIIDEIIDNFDAVSNQLGKIYSSLSIFYNVDFNPIAKLDKSSLALG